MIKYYLTALALKAFSSCEPARRVYRHLGNTLGGQGRTMSKMPFYYFERVERNVSLCRKYGLLQQGEQLIELGTGWVHWEALTLRLFFDFQGTLYDVWDNRQLPALKGFLRQLAQRFGEPGFLTGCDFERARSLIAKIEKVNSFPELYELLGFKYVLDPSGLMAEVPRKTFQVAISAGVMEHIPAETAPVFIKNMAGLLVKGGVGIHSINITDHLHLYDRSASAKQYLVYSERQWQLFFENGVQYINRIQRCDWLKMFSAAGFTLLEEGGAYADFSALPIHPRYQNLDRKDIDCTTLDLVVRTA